MPRILDASQDIHQPIYDTYVRNVGVTNVANNFQLFGSANNGDRSKTNLFTPGQLASDSVFLVRSIRCLMYFQGLNDPAFTAAYGSTPTMTGVVADNARAQDLYGFMAYGGIFTFQTTGKDYLTAPLAYAPAGMGPSGFATGTDRHVITNGVASHQAILKLSKPVKISPRQGFAVKLEFFPFVRTPQGLGAGGAAINADVDPLLMLNQFDGIKELQIHLDGVLTRDVE